ncbi:MAG TPA: hypothetical protein VFZ68_06610 [Acidimicrobiales bacterium]
MQRAGQSELTGEAPELSPAAGHDGPALDGLTSDARRRLRRAWWCGAAPLLALHLWILTAGRADLFRSDLLSGVFDTQARSFLDGHLAVPRELVGVVGVPVDGETHVHHGPVPALLRIPVLLVTDRLDGRLAILSMLAAVAVLAAASFRLVCALRAMVRGTSPVRRAELVATGGLAAATMGSPPLFLASATVVHHEALLWGIALAVAAFDAVARYQLRPTERRLAVAVLLIAATLLTRLSLGLGPLVALGLTGTARVLPSVRRAGRAVAATPLARRVTDQRWVGIARAWARRAQEWIDAAREWIEQLRELVRRAREWIRSVRPREGHILPERQLPVPGVGHGPVSEVENGEAPAGGDDQRGAGRDPEGDRNGEAQPGGPGPDGGDDAQRNGEMRPDGGVQRDGDVQGSSGDGTGHDGAVAPGDDRPGSGGAGPDHGGVGADGGERAPAHRRVVHALGIVVVAGVLPLAVSFGLHLARFGTVVGSPGGDGLTSPAIADQREVLRAADDRPHGLRFVPTTLREYLRPGGLDLRRDFPWIDFPADRPWLVGDTPFDDLDWSASLPATAPAVTALAGVALVWAVRTRQRRRSGPWLSPLWLGALAGSAGVVTFGYVANRHLTEMLPLVLLPGVVGYHVVVRAAPDWQQQRRRLVVGVLVGLAAVGVLANTALALSYQRERGPVVPEPLRAEWVSWRARLPGDQAPMIVDADAALPDTAVEGRLAIVGDCQAMYVRVGRDWKGVERGPAVGVHDLEVDLDALSDGERVPLITLGSEDDLTIVAIRRLDDEWVRVDASRPPASGGGWRLGLPARLSGTVALRVDADPREPPGLVTHGRQVLLATPLDASDPVPAIGRAPEGQGVVTRYPDGAVRAVPTDRDVCRSVHPEDDGLTTGAVAG